MSKISPRHVINPAVAILALTLCSVGTAQTLARPGWAGSGMTATPWWKRPILYRADPRGFGGLKGLAEHMDYIHSLAWTVCC